MMQVKVDYRDVTCRVLHG